MIIYAVTNGYLDDVDVEQDPAVGDGLPTSTCATRSAPQVLRGDPDQEGARRRPDGASSSAAIERFKPMFKAE